jgi:hypothetical protein
MNDDILKHQPSWRYCRVRAGEKKPYPNGWQNSPLTLEQVDSANIGLMLGPNGNGVCAIDFDGLTAVEWFNKEIGCNLPDTPAWSSGREGRMQMAFNVPNEIWEFLRTRKIVTKPPSKAGAGDGEGFEFRWAGGQSVLPPSVHPVTQKPYVWIIDATTPVAEIPLPLLEHWVDLCHQEIKPLDTTPEINLDELEQNEIDEVERLLRKIKQQHPALGYDDWCKVCWATAHHLGREAAKVLINLYYPEQKAGEYNSLFRSWNKSKSHKIGTLYHMAGETRTQKKERHQQRYQTYLEEIEELEMLRKELKRRQHNEI